MARVNDTLYVLGSHGNNSSGEPKPARRVLFTAAITGSGADTALTYIGSYNGLWDALRGVGRGQRQPPRLRRRPGDRRAANDPNGFNIEGIEFAPGSTSTAYLGFRAPKVTHDGQPSAVIVPVENANASSSAEPNHEFGDPIYLDLGGRTIREIRKNSDDEYLISASRLDAGPPGMDAVRLGRQPDSTPVAVKDLPEPDPVRTGAWESIVSVPHPLTDGGSASLDRRLRRHHLLRRRHPRADESKSFRKSYIDEFTTSSFTEYPTAPAFSPPADLSSPSQTVVVRHPGLDQGGGRHGYILSRRSVQVPRPPSRSVTCRPPVHGSGGEHRVHVRHHRGEARRHESAAVAPQCHDVGRADRPAEQRPLDVADGHGLTIAWTKKPGSAKYEVKLHP